MVSVEDFKTLQDTLKELMDESKLEKAELRSLRLKMLQMNEEKDSQTTAQQGLIDRVKNDEAALQNLLGQRVTLDQQIKQAEQQLATSKLELDDLRIHDDKPPRFSAHAREENIDVTFGDVLTPEALLEFIDGYKLAKYLNQEEQIANWDDKRFRAAKLRKALRGPAASYVRNENAMASSWTEDDDEIIARLEARYLTTEAFESKIRDAEEVCQQDHEPLPEFLTRVQRLIIEAYPGEPVEVKNKRVVWKFLSGLKSKDIRAEIIKAKWMVNRNEAKPAEEILMVAETARKAMEGAAVTGQMKGGKIAPVQDTTSNDMKEIAGEMRNILAAYQQASQSNSKSTGNKTNSRRSTKKDDGNTRELCLYCKKEHWGGWQKCYKRRNENPSWTPESSTEKTTRKKDF